MKIVCALTKWADFMPKCKRHLFTSHLAAFKNERNMFAQQLPEPLTDDLVADLNGSCNWATYCGVDPTGPSLHLGHLFPLMALFNIRRVGYPVIVLIGGATARIGDPSDKKEQRKVLSIDVLNDNKDKLRKQIANLDRSFIKYMEDQNSDLNKVGELKVVDNSEWYDEESLIPFISESGRWMSVSHMLSLSFVKQRLLSGNKLSLAELFYQMLQAHDFLQLLERYNCRAQVGGSDQWGNMLGGYEYIKARKGVRTLCLTTPLLLSGQSKMGKTNTSPAASASSGSVVNNSNVWLDPKMTSPYAMYQYLIQRSDAEAPQMLKSLSIAHDVTLRKQLSSTSSESSHDVRFVQKSLAETVVQFVHGANGLKEAKLATSLLHARQPGLDNIDEDAVNCLLKSVQVVDASCEETIGQVLSKCHFFAHEVEKIEETVKNGSVKINGTKVIASDAAINQLFDVNQYPRYEVLAIGKHYRTLLRLTSTQSK